ncbi:ligand-binding sensor domain-containing diguanylate cyclase [soil metagenome]
MPHEKERNARNRKEGNCFTAISYFFTVSLFLLFSLNTSAQYRFDIWTTDNGLPQNGVRGIAQTPDGYLWFTTFDGLVRFDGVRFTVFNKSNSTGILSNRFFLLRLEPDGSLLAGTEDSGLVVWRNGEFHSLTVADGLPSNNIISFLTDSKGEFFIETAAGRCYFRGGKFVALPDSEIPNQHSYLSPANNLWLYDLNSIRQLLPDKREIIYPFKFNYYNERLSGVTLFEDSGGNLWFGDLAGVYRLKNGNISRFTTPDGIPARTILRPFVEDTTGGVWFAANFDNTKKISLARFGDGRFTTWGEDAGLANLIAADIFKDREGTIWATGDGGLIHVQKQFIKSYSTSDNLIHSEVYPLFQTHNGDVFVGTTKGLSRFRDGKFSTVADKNYKGEILSVSALFEDERGRLWIGSAGGDLFLLENEKLRRIEIGDNATTWAIEKDRAGNVWIGTNKGLFKFKNDRLIVKYTVADGLPSDDVKVIHEDHNGLLWLGTYEGLVKFENGEFSTLKAADGLAGNRVRSIYETADGTLWIGTYDSGMSRLRDGKFFNFTEREGLFNNGVFQILEDAKNNFWISCNKGIYRVSKQELEDFADGKIAKINSVSYGKQDGMLNTEANGGRQPAGIKTSDGRLWFPTQNGVAIVDPKEVLLNPNPPPVQIENVLIDRTIAAFQNGITLQANENNLEIRYTGISFIKPEQVKFRYRIEGLEENWTDVETRREVYFPFLPAGEYTFHVIAANSDGVWNLEGTSLKIRVNAPFWRTTWFIVLSSIVAIAVVFIIFRLRERELKRRQLLHREFSRRLLESQEIERKRIASEMHDSLGQYLLAIKNWAMFGLNSLSEKDAARKYLTEVSETSSLAIEEVREIAHNLRPYQLERLGLTNTLEYMLKNLKNSSKIIFKYKIEKIDGFLSKDDEIIFYRVVQECLNNIIKHSAAENAWLSVKSDGKLIEFVCRDDGIGFDFATAKNSSKSGLGLNGIAERVKILKGEFKVESEIGKGTKIIVKVAKIDE